MKLTKLVAAGAAVLVCAGVSYGAGMWSTLPVIGGSAYCASSLGVGPVQGGITGQGAGVAGAGVVTGTTICAQTVPAGPAALTGTEYIPADIYTPGTATQSGGPTTAILPVTALGNGYGGTQVVTTNASVVVANGISNLISNQGVATIASITMPPNPFQNQQFCIRNAGSGILTTTSIVVGTAGQSIVQGAAVASLGVEVGAAASTYVLTNACWIYNVANTTWYRVT